VYLLWRGLIQSQTLLGVLLPGGLIHRSQSLQLEFTLEFQPVEYSSDALAICQPSHMATAVIKTLPGITQ